jgi:hypothetical protein
VYGLAYSLPRVVNLISFLSLEFTILPWPCNPKNIVIIIGGGISSRPFKSIFLTVFISYRKNNLIRDINNYLSNKIFSFYLKQDLNFFLKKESSKMISNIILEIQKFSYHLIEAVLTLITESFIILAILIFL